MEFKPRPYTKENFYLSLQEPYVNPETNEVVAPKQKISTRSKTRSA